MHYSKEPYYTIFINSIGPIMDKLKHLNFGHRLYIKLLNTYPELNSYINHSSINPQIHKSQKNNINHVSNYDQVDSTNSQYENAHNIINNIESNECVIYQTRETADMTSINDFNNFNMNNNNNFMNKNPKKSINNFNQEKYSKKKFVNTNGTEKNKMYK